MRRQTPSNTERYRVEKTEHRGGEGLEKNLKKTEKDRKKQAGDANVVRKHIIKFDKRQANC